MDSEKIMLDLNIGYGQVFFIVLAMFIAFALAVFNWRQSKLALVTRLSNTLAISIGLFGALIVIDKVAHYEGLTYVCVPVDHIALADGSSTSTLTWLIACQDKKQNRIYLKGAGQYTVYP